MGWFEDFFDDTLDVVADAVVGVSSAAIDTAVKARQAGVVFPPGEAVADFWDVDMDYNHGTGHGVGYVLNVHEGPNSFRWKPSPNRAKETVLEEGMVTTDEPGIYIEGKYGIRTENELICRKGVKNQFGQFMYFENVTYVPIDLDAVDPDQMTYVERKQLNDYHAMVFNTMSPYFEGEELEFLRKYTRAI